MDNFKQLQNGYSNLRSANITDGYVNLTEAELMRFMRAQSQVGRLQHQLKCCGPDEKSYWSNLKLNGTQLRFSWIGMQLNWEGKCELLAKTMGRPNCGKRLVSVAFAAMWIQSILLVISAFFHVFLLSGAIDERVERTPIEVKLF